MNILNFRRHFLILALLGGSSLPGLASQNDDRLNSNQVNIKNSCSRTLIVGLHYRNLNDQWATEGWWTLQPGQTMPFSTQEKNFFLYGQTQHSQQDLVLRFTGTEYYDKIRGSDQTFGFMGIHFENPEVPGYVTYTQDLTCPGVPPYNSVALAFNSRGDWSVVKALDLETAKQNALNQCRVLWKEEPDLILPNLPIGVAAGINANHAAHQAAERACTVTAVVGNDRPTCMALARSSSRTIYYAWNERNQEAINAALQSCSNATNSSCGLITSFCND